VKRFLCASLTLLALAPLAKPGGAAAQSPCLHGPNEDAAERARRNSALRLVRAINTAEVNEAWRKTNSFAPLANLGIDLAAAPGFEADFTTDGQSYALLLRDRTDACGFMFSTNQKGVIFQGYPIDYEVQPIRR
jgi:hypothetical protein